MSIARERWDDTSIIRNAGNDATIARKTVDNSVKTQRNINIAHKKRKLQSASQELTAKETQIWVLTVKRSACIRDSNMAIVNRIDADMDVVLMDISSVCKQKANSGM